MLIVYLQITPSELLMSSEAAIDIVQQNAKLREDK